MGLLTQTERRGRSRVQPQSAGLLTAGRRVRGLLSDAAEWAGNNPLEAAALATSPIPIVGDVVGGVADAKALYDDPSWTNAGLAAVGLLPFVPGGLAATVRSVNHLPMDQASRMARADELFPINAYHGTNKDISEFRNVMRGGSTKAKSAQLAHWFTSDAKQTASGYANKAGDGEVQKLIDASYAAERKGDFDAAEKLMIDAENLEQIIGKGENVMPARLRGKMKVIDMDGAQYDPDDVNLSDILKTAKEDGFDGVEFRNFSDEADYGVYNPVTHYAVFDPKNIRSRFAKFDPSKLNSSDLLAGVAGAGLLTAASMREMDFSGTTDDERRNQ